MSWTNLIVRGALAGLAGTVAMDAVGYARYRRRGGRRPFVAWELSLGLEGFEAAPAPAQLGQQAARALLGIELAPATAPVANSVVYFTHGALWGVGHALAFRSREPKIRAGLATGALMWATTYGLLQAAGLYRPMREYPLQVLAKDFGVHLVFGAGLGASLRFLGSRRCRRVLANFRTRLTRT